jgi:hypothetical protein
MLCQATRLFLNILWGRIKKKAEEIKARASCLSPMMLEDLGYQLEK